MNKLAYWRNADTGAISRVFPQSPHCPRKDDAHRRKRERADYLPKTAQEAAGTVYSTAWVYYERWQRSRGQERNYAW